MRHFRTPDDVLEMLIDEHVREGIPVVLRDGQAFVAATEEGETGALELRDINLTEAANLIWEEFNATRH